MNFKSKFLISCSSDLNSNLTQEHKFTVLNADGMAIEMNSIEELEELRDTLVYYIPLIKESLKALNHDKK